MTTNVDIFLSQLKIHGFDPSQIKTDPASLENWGKDWTKHFAPNASAILFPKTTKQVQTIVKLCNELGIVITPSGGRTGLSAGAVASNGEVVISLDKMNQVLGFYPADRMVEVQAGMITKDLQDFAESKGLYYPVDFASAGSSQIGGNIGIDSVAVEKLLATGHVQKPFETDAPFYALLEFEAPYEPIMDTAMQIFEDCMAQGWILDGVMSQSIAQAQELWKLREYISETISVFTPYKNDVSVLITHVPDFIADIDKIVADNYPDFQVCWFGHIGDGNLHLNILKPENLSKDEFFEKCQVVNKYVFETVKKYNGSISAEHGVGMTKKPYLQYTRPEAEIAYLREIKQVFDPNGIMNKGKIFD